MGVEVKENNKMSKKTTEHWLTRYDIWLADCGVTSIEWVGAVRNYVIEFEMVWGRSNCYQTHRKLHDIVRSMKVHHIYKVVWNRYHEKYDGFWEEGPFIEEIE